MEIPLNGTATRAAKTQANKKLDAQAKAFAEFQRQNSATTRAGRATKRQKLDEEEEFSTPRRTLGTRMSKRLRRSLNDEDEWQQVPDEWLDGDDEAHHAAKKTDARSEENNLVTDEDNTAPQAAETTKAKTGLESDAESISDLTELSTTSDRADDDNEADGDEDTEKEGETEKEDEAEATEEHDEQQRQSPVDEEFVEWEMVSISLPRAELWNNRNIARYAPHLRNGIILQNDLRRPHTMQKKHCSSYCIITSYRLLSKTFM
jgi:hypothetical protein